MAWGSAFGKALPCGQGYDFVKAKANAWARGRNYIIRSAAKLCSPPIEPWPKDMAMP